MPVFRPTWAVDCLGRRILSTFFTKSRLRSSLAIHFIDTAIINMDVATGGWGGGGVAPPPTFGRVQIQVKIGYLLHLKSGKV